MFRILILLDVVMPGESGIEIRRELKKEYATQDLQPVLHHKARGAGTGLGLSISYDIIVRGHGESFAPRARWTGRSS